MLNFHDSLYDHPLFHISSNNLTILHNSKGNTTIFLKKKKIRTKIDLCNPMIKLRSIFFYHLTK